MGKRLTANTQTSTHVGGTMNQILQMEKPRNTVLVGPGLVGKSFCGGKIKATLPQVPLINLGDYFRQLRQRDVDFDRQYGPIMDAGDLLPDDVIIPHSHKLLLQNQQAIAMATDGICRTGRQVRETAEAGLLNENDTVLMLDASDEVLIARHKHRLEHRTSGNRADDGKFFERLQIYRHHEPHVRSELLTIGVKIIPINANEPLEVIGLKVAGYVHDAFMEERRRRRN